MLLHDLISRYPPSPALCQLGNMILFIKMKNCTTASNAFISCVTSTIE